MGCFLLDTHTAIWFFNGNYSLSEIAKKTIIDTSNIKYLSIASAWELAIKINIGKLEFKGRVEGFIQLAENNGFTVLPIKSAHLCALDTLPMIHREPFDRLLVATALAEEMRLITADENIAQYNVPQLW